MNSLPSPFSNRTLRSRILEGVPHLFSSLATRHSPLATPLLYLLPFLCLLYLPLRASEGPQPKPSPQTPASPHLFSSLATRHSPLATSLLYLLTLLYFLNLPSAFAAGRVECNSLPSKLLSRSVPYCIVLPASFDAEKSKKFPILYSLHGLGDNEQFFVHSGAWNLVEDLRDKKELKEFLIATPDAGAGFYINSRDGKNRYEDFLLQEFFPFIEKRYRVAPGRANRAISGVSMGGYGALHLAFRHPQLFGSVSAHSAALIEKLPGFLGASPSTSPRARVLGGVFGNPPDPTFWDQNSPIALAHTANLSGLKIYFDCGDNDDYGFYSGATALDKLLTSRHIPHEFHLYPGRHDPAYFAEHLPASLKFHSKLFP